MANFRLEIKNVSRAAPIGDCRSVAKLLNYISGERVHDAYRNETYYRHRNDVLRFGIFLPSCAPPSYRELQFLCSEIDKAEVRYDARTAREFIGSLPNEIPIGEQWQIVRNFIERCFTKERLCAVAAIHAGINENNPCWNNPHTHIIVSTRYIEPDGFSVVKDREHNRREFVSAWRKMWALEHNLAYERCGLDIRVSHESLEVQGIDREPLKHLSRIDYQREQRGERTVAGSERREIIKRNERRARQNQVELDRTFELELL